MEFFFTSLVILFVIVYNTRPMTISRITKKLNASYQSIDINISALTILLDYGYPEELIFKYYQNLSKFLERVKLKSDNDIYNYRKQLVAEFEKIHNSEPERIARRKEEKRIDTEFKKMLNIYSIPFAIMLALYLIKTFID